jgi:hypothetical protein
LKLSRKQSLFNSPSTISRQHYQPRTPGNVSCFAIAPYPSWKEL